jgi:outer membrane protein TolC
VKRLLIALTAWLSLAGTPNHAAEAPAAPPADLAALLKEAEAISPALQAAAARQAAARHLPSQAQVAPDPEVSVAYTNDGVSSLTLGESDMSVLAFTWTQEVPHPGKLKRSGEVASFEAERAGKDLERSRLEVAAAVKTAFADLYRLDRTSAILAETHTVLDSLAAVARLRYEVGEGIQESVLKAQTEILKVEAEQARVAQDRRAAEIRLNAAVGRSVVTPIGPATILPPATLPEEEDRLVEAAVASSPEIGGLEATVRSGEAGVSLAKLDLKPDFIWSASYQNRGGLDPLVMGMFGLRLPVHRQRKQAEEVLQKESELLAAQKDLSSLKITIQASVRELVSRVRRADRLLALFGQGVIPQAENTLESAQSSYQVGRIGFLDVLNDLTALFTARTELASQEAERLQALAALEPLLGRELVDASGGSAGEGGENVVNR